MILESGLLLIGKRQRSLILEQGLITTERKCLNAEQWKGFCKTFKPSCKSKTIHCESFFQISEC